MVKPVDSSASRGVQRVDSLAQLKDAFDLALSYSRKGQVLIEDLLMGVNLVWKHLLKRKNFHYSCYGKANNR